MTQQTSCRLYGNGGDAIKLLGVLALLMAVAACAGSRASPTPLPPTPDARIVCQNNAQFVADGEGTPLGESGWVTKTWLLRNNGDCVWTADYRIATVGEYQFEDDQASSLSIKLNKEVVPGEDAMVEVGFHAPAMDAVFVITWQLQDPEGNSFGDSFDLNVKRSADSVCSTDECATASPRVVTCVEGDCEGGSANDSALAICTSGDCGIPAMGVYVCDTLSNASDGTSPNYVIDPTSGAPVICIYDVAPGEMVVGTVTDPAGNVFIYNGPAVSLPYEAAPEAAAAVGGEIIIESAILPGQWEAEVWVDDHQFILPPLEVETIR